MQTAACGMGVVELVLAVAGATVGGLFFPLPFLLLPFLGELFPAESIAVAGLVKVPLPYEGEGTAAGGIKLPLPSSDIVPVVTGLPQSFR